MVLIACCRLRVAGLRGLQGVVRKTVSDDLQTNIWDHMDKIVPSLLYNMQNTRSVTESQVLFAQEIIICVYKILDI